MAITLIAIARPKFPLGEIVITASARDRIEPTDIQQGLVRHAGGDWGAVCEEDRRENERSLKEGYRLMSVFGRGEARFWIITEADRSVTTVLLPLDY